MLLNYCSSHGRSASIVASAARVEVLVLLASALQSELG